MENGNFWAGRSEEHYVVGPCATADDAAKEYFDDDPDEDECVIGVGEQVPVDVDGDDFLQWLADGLSDQLYEDALDYWCSAVPKAAREELGKRLTAELRKWLAEQGEETEWTVIHQKELRRRAPEAASA